MPSTKGKGRYQYGSTGHLAANLIRHRARLNARRKASKAPVKTVAKNTLAIRQLKNQVNGHIQRNYQFVDFLDTPGSFVISPKTPLCFAVNDFTREDQGGGKLYFPIYTGVSPNINTSAAIAAKWQQYNPSLALGLDQKFRMWKDNNDDTVAKSCYQPVYADYRINLSRNTTGTAQPELYIRMDILRVKRFYQKSSYHDYSLPEALGCLQNLAVGVGDNTRNSINPDLFHVKTRWFKMPAQDATRTAASKTFHYRTKFPKKLIKLDLDESGGLVEEFHLGQDPKVPIWMVLSVSDRPTGAPTTDLKVTMTRKIVWRDQFGVSM